MSRGPAGALAVLVAATFGLLSAAGARALPIGQGNETCLKLGEPTPEIYGPTDIGATTGNGRLSVAVNPQGSLSVLRWPSPSYYEQLKYFTQDRGLPRLGLHPNEGAFSGLMVWLRSGGRRMIWLRSLRVSQRYASEDSDTVVTRLHSPELRFAVEIEDTVPPGAAVLLRRHVLHLLDGSRVRRARLVAFANLNPVASKAPYLPVQDWCKEVRAMDTARYEPAADALVYSIQEFDQAIGQPRSVAVAIGASAPSDGHHVGADTYTGDPSTANGPQSAYDDAADGTLSGNSSFGPAEADAALSVPIGRKPVTVAFAAAATPDTAVALLNRWRASDPVRAAAAKREAERRWMARAPLPLGAPDEVRRLAKRALISLHQAIDTRAGPDRDQVAIVASLATQSPYGQDWIRDGAFFNEALDAMGHHGLVERHNAFYVDVQHKLEEGAPPGTPLTTCAPPTPDGNWFMTNYADGPDAGTFPWEIDEAAFGLWTLWRHYGRADPERRAQLIPYLQGVYPAIRRTADFLVAFRDPLTLLTPPGACEDDNVPAPGQPTMHASGPVLLAMRSAVAAAKALGQAADLARYRTRLAELESAIDSHYGAGAGPWTSDYGVGGWLMWPVRVKPYSHPRMRAQASTAWDAVAPSFDAPGGPRLRGQYEAKTLLGLAHLHRAVAPGGLARVKQGLLWIARVQAGARETGILGETWYIRDGRMLSVVSQPHVWAQILFYLAAIEAYGREPFSAG